MIVRVKKEECGEKDYLKMTSIERVRYRLKIYHKLESVGYWIRANQTTYVIEFGTRDKYSGHKELAGYIDVNSGNVIYIIK